MKNPVVRYLFIYLFVLVSLEYEYRKYETTDTYQWATHMLAELFKKLGE